jgi:GT2 family glycosyltransferase
VSCAVTVVVATRNRRGPLIATLARLSALPERPRVIVVDNASRDRTARAVRERFPAVDVVELAQNAGGAARTVGARRAQTPLVAFSDDDSWWAPGALSAAAELFDRYPDLGLLAARVVVEPGGRDDPTCREMAASPVAVDVPLPGRPVLGFVACGAIARRDAFLAVGGFQPRLGIGGEEALLAIDLVRAGWGVTYVPEVVAHHAPPRRRDASGRDRVVTRNGIWTAWLRRSPAAAARTTAAAAVRAATSAPVRAGVVEALRGLPWVLPRRRRPSADLERALRAIEGVSHRDPVAIRLADRERRS